MKHPTISPEAVARYLELAARPDVRAATALALDLLDEGVGFSDVVLGLLAAAQVEVGRRWASNEWTVAQEHAATSVTDSVLATIAASAAVPQRPELGHVVVACAEGEWHSLPARMAAELLRAEGWRVTFLGPSAPAEHVGRFLAGVLPDAVALACAVPMFFPGVVRVVLEARSAGVPVLAGGRGFGTDQRWARRLGAEGWAASGGEAARLLLHWTDGGRPSSPPLEAPPEALLLESRIDELADAAFADLLGRAVLSGYSQRQLQRTREDLGYTLRFAVAAVLVEDASLLLGYADWLTALLDVRHVPPSAVAASFDALASAVGPDLAVARALLQEAAAHLVE